MDLMRSLSSASVLVGKRAARSVSSFLGISLEDNQLEFWQHKFTTKAKNRQIAPSLLNLLPKRFNNFEFEKIDNEETTFGVKKITTAVSAPNQNNEKEMRKGTCSKSYSDSFVTHHSQPTQDIIPNTQSECRNIVSENLQDNDGIDKETASVESQKNSLISVRFHPNVDENENFSKFQAKKYNPDLVIDNGDDIVVLTDNSKTDIEPSGSFKDVVGVRECDKCKGDLEKLKEVVRLSKQSNEIFHKQWVESWMRLHEEVSLKEEKCSVEVEATGLSKDNKNNESSIVVTPADQQVYKDHKPIFSTFVTVTQLFVFSVLCYFGGIAPIGVTQQLTYAEGVKTFIGTETISVSTYPNVWIGPNAKYWIGVGAMYSPCMRKDHFIKIESAKDNLYYRNEPLGCCEIDIRNTAGTTTEKECQKLTYGVGTWSLPVCSARMAGSNYVAHTIRPCCVGLTGRCEMLSHEHCAILHGTYHQRVYEHCSQVNCLEDICTLGKIKVKINTDAPNQWWRFFLPLFYHNGIIHILLTSIAQWIILRPIEAIAGGVRVAIIYFTCIFAGNLMSGIFIPYMPQVGATSAVCGFLGVTFIEIIQSKNLTQSTFVDFIKTLTILAVFLVSGTLPFVDNFAQIGGFLTGIVTGIIFLPYIVFGRWNVMRRRLLVCVTTPILLSWFFILIVMFYIVQSSEFCSWCHYLNCIPYTDSMCNHTWLTYKPF
ncbi:inactive rhomboid protein 1-like [Antedon mediterranea]|uniref:inactive rhomboid protein 1-like n=1 Tax=Antedon mediterranea TaxID=105859 RepID=UPI003AF4F114